jgi:hypothetical protein
MGWQKQSFLAIGCVEVEGWSSRSLEESSYPFLVLDAMHLKVRRQSAVRSTTVMLAVGINETGQRVILGRETAFGETGEGGAGSSASSSAEASPALRSLPVTPMKGSARRFEKPSRA